MPIQGIDVQHQQGDEILTDTTGIPFAKDISAETGELKLVCDDPTSGQSITFGETDGGQRITYSYQESGETHAVTLTDDETTEIIAWKNSGRRNSFWNWPGWDAVRNRNKNDQS